ncbi:MAG: nuclear transport factor 2 family protein [Alloprevotella sp.]|nr:nuclear transport factor 2 family protein [Alloprevotella sp.]
MALFCTFQLQGIFVSTCVTDTYKVLKHFHMNGQQSIDFVDDTHDTGTCYALATLVTEEDGKDKLTVHAVRYYDKYVKIDGRWWISEREQHFEWSALPSLA